MPQIANFVKNFPCQYAHRKLTSNPITGGEKKAKKKMPVSQQVSSGGINVTMTSDPTGSDRYEAPNTPAPPPPPPPVMEPLATSRIYATTGASSLNNNRTTEIKTMSSAPRYASPHERVQVCERFLKLACHSVINIAIIQCV